MNATKLARTPSGPQPPSAVPEGLRAPGVAAAPLRAEPVRSLKGFSGAQLVLFTQGHKSLVRKTSGAPSQDARLRQQCEKLRWLNSCGIPTPRVLGEGESEEGRAYYDMEYVPARTLATVICDATPFDPASVLSALLRMFSLFAITAGGALEPEAFHAKIDQIASGGRTGACAPHEGAIATMAMRLKQMSWDGIPASDSHGDLTLENVLICPERGAVVIDCDGGWLSSWWIDAAKLYQDVIGHWCLRSLYLADETSQSLLSASQRLERFKPSLDALMTELDPHLMGHVPQLAALHLFRTLPYAQDDRIVAFVLARMQHLLAVQQSRGRS